MTTNQTIDGVPRELLLDIEYWLKHMESEKVVEGRCSALKELRALLDAPADTRTETVPKHKFDTLVQHCKRLEGDIAQARAHVNEITLYQQNAVWFWQHDGEDFLESLSCPIIIQPHHLRELLKGVAPAAQPQGEPVAFTAVGVLRDDGDGGLAPEWILEGGTSELWAGAILLIADEDQELCAEDGHCELYRVPVEQPAPVAVDVLSTGFYTTESGGGKYAINIGFRSMADMQAADTQLRELLKRR